MNTLKIAVLTVGSWLCIPAARAQLKAIHATDKDKVQPEVIAPAENTNDAE